MAKTKEKATPRTRLTATARKAIVEGAATEVFAQRGYDGASMDEIARRSGVSVPVVYDHFASKQELHQRLLERHFAELRAIWGEQLLGDDPLERRLPRAFDAWFAYVQEHPYAWRMLFRDTTGDPGVQAMHRDVIDRSRTAAMPLLISELDPRQSPRETAASKLELELAWEPIRAVLQGLALWWYDNPGVPRERIVATAMDAIWVGFERTRTGERWQPA